MRFRAMSKSDLLRTTLPLCLLALCSVAQAAEWQGQMEMRDGIQHALNPSEGMEPPTTLRLDELWRVGGDTDDEDQIFGIINQVIPGPDDELYLLDRQLDEVRVFSGDGEFVRSIGRPGDGPGEFRRALDMFFLPDGNLGVLQVAPGRIVKLAPDGSPAGEHPLPRDEGGSPPRLMAGEVAGSQLLLEIGENIMQEGRLDIVRSLVLVDSQGTEIKRLIQHTRTLSFVDFLFKEDEWRTFDDRWAVAPSGEIYAVEKYLDYEITVRDVMGEPLRVITREYEHWDRSKEQKDEMYDIFDSLLQNQLPDYSIEVSDFDPDISGIFPREDGTLWVLGSHGTRARPEGCLGIFDVFDQQGRFLRQVSLLGQGDPLMDGYVFHGDCLYVITGLLEANIASRGGHKGEQGELEEEPEPLAVICYRLDSVLAGM